MCWGGSGRGVGEEETGNVSNNREPTCAVFILPPRAELSHSLAAGEEEDAGPGPGVDHVRPRGWQKQRPPGLKAASPPGRGGRAPASGLAGYEGRGTHQEKGGPVTKTTGGMATTPLRPQTRAGGRREHVPAPEQARHHAEGLRALVNGLGETEVCADLHPRKEQCPNQEEPRIRWLNAESRVKNRCQFSNSPQTGPGTPSPSPGGRHPGPQETVVQCCSETGVVPRRMQAPRLRERNANAAEGAMLPHVHRGSTRPRTPTWACATGTPSLSPRRDRD